MPPPSPEPEPEPIQRRPARTRRFPPMWRDFQATSYTPVESIPQVNEEAFEQRIEQPVTQEPVALSTPNLSEPSPHHSSLNQFRVLRVSAADPTTRYDKGQPGPAATSPVSHPFKNDSTFEVVKTLQLGPSSKTAQGMNAVAGLITSKKVDPDEILGFNATTELRHLDDFAAKSPIAGGPWQTGSVKIKMPCMRGHNRSISKEEDAPEFEIPGVRYRSLVDILISKIQDPNTSRSFQNTPFTEWWCPPGSTTPIRIYGEAYSSDIAVQLYEEIKGIPPPADSPQIESVVILLMLGSDATHLASFGTASLWPIYVFFGNMSKYDSSRPSEFAACHLAYLPKVQ